MKVLEHISNKDTKQLLNEFYFSRFLTKDGITIYRLKYKNWKRKNDKIRREMKKWSDTCRKYTYVKFEHKNDKRHIDFLFEILQNARSFVL